MEVIGHILSGSLRYLHIVIAVPKVVVRKIYCLMKIISLNGYHLINRSVYKALSYPIVFNRLETLAQSNRRYM